MLQAKTASGSVGPATFPSLPSSTPVTPETSGGFTSSPSELATSVPGRRAAGPEPPGPGSLVAAAPRCRAAVVPVWRVMYKNASQEPFLYMWLSCNLGL